jgi:hypothetical protein
MVSDHDGRLRLVIGGVAAAALVIGVLLYALDNGRIRSAGHQSAETGERNAPAGYPVPAPPTKHETKETSPTMPPHGP